MRGSWRPAVSGVLGMLGMLLAVVIGPPGAAGAVRQADDLHRPLDEILDIYVRDGFVYYRALQIERGRLDRYVGSLDVSPTVYAAWSREQQMAFWINAYNAFVLRTVIDHYPIRGQASEYPADSIRQISGAFERLSHRAAGRTVTLDEIETTVLPEFEEPRLYLALGRGAVDSARLRSEAYTSTRLNIQLDQVAEEFATKPRHIRLDPIRNVLGVSPIVSWRESEFVATYDGAELDPRFRERSPIERAILVFISPRLLPLEREALQANDFRVEYQDFDWRLNDLTGGRPD